MTNTEAAKQWQQHDPWTRASKDLIQRINRVNTAAKKFDALVEEVGEALV